MNKRGLLERINKDSIICVEAIGREVPASRYREKNI